MFSSKADHHPSEDAFLAPTLPSAIERLMRTVGFRRISPAQPIAVNEDYPTQCRPVIDPRHAVRLRKEGGKLGHLLVGQPVEGRSCDRSVLRAVNHAEQR